MIYAAIGLLFILLIMVGIANILNGPKRDKTPHVTAEATDAIIAAADVTAEPTEEPAATATAIAIAEQTSTVAPLATATQVFQSTYVSDGSMRSATFRCIGDFVIHEPIYTAYKQADGTYDFSETLSEIYKIMANADYTIANVDGPMGGHGKRGYKGYPQFNTPESLIVLLKNCGVDMLTLANNHALDTYYDGLKAEIENCIAAGMDYVGAARSQEEDDAPVIKEINGIKVGFMNYTESTNTMENYSDEAAKIYGLDIARYADFNQDAQDLRDAGADVIVAIMHWGDEYELTPNSNEKTYANRLVEAGVDVIIGGHPHVVQPAYWLEGVRSCDGAAQKTLCVYSLGNYLSDQRQQYRDGGIIFEFTIQETSEGVFEIQNPGYIPTYVWREGSDSKGYRYKVLPVETFKDKRPSGMSDSEYQALVRKWDETINLMSVGTAGSLISVK